MKNLFVLVIGIFLFGLIASAGEPSVGVFGVDDNNGASSEKGVEEIEGAIDEYSPLDEDGKIDYGKYKPFVTKAELRIGKINAWLDDNVGWMRYIFHMKPEVSFLFFINIYVILWFFVLLFLNSDGLWFFIGKKRNARIFGFMVFFIFLVVKLYYGIAGVIYDWACYFWFIFIDAGIIFIILGIIFGLVFAFLGFPVIVLITGALARYRAARDMARRNMKMDAGIGAIEAVFNETNNS